MKKAAYLPFLILMGPGCDNDDSAPTATPPQDARPAAPGGENEPRVATVWQLEDATLVQPESVHAVGDFLYFSQMRDSPEKPQPDEDGTISRVSMDGTGYVEAFAKGLNSPKGMRASADEQTLWVADLDRVVAVSLADGSWSDKSAIVIKGIEGVPDAELLNDVALGPDGSIYVSDTFGDRVYRIIPGDQPQVDVLVEDVDHPNGLLVERDQLLIASWGSPLNKVDFSTETPGRILRVQLGSGDIVSETESIGNLDGIESDGKGGYLVTDWMAGELLRVTPDAAGRRGPKVETVRKLGQGAADLAFVPSTGQVIVPVTSSNLVVSFALDR